MNRFVLPALLIGASLAQAVTIPPTCASLGDFGALLTAGTCTLGLFTIKDPSYTGPVAASSINLSVLSGVDSLALSFGSSSFVSGPLSTTSFTFGYTIDPPPDIIKGISAELDGADQEAFDFDRLLAAADLIGGNAIAVQYLLCAGAAFDGSSCGAEFAGLFLNLPDTSGDQFATAPDTAGGVTFSAPVNTVGVMITVDLSNGGRFDQLNSTFPFDVPEPGSMALVGVGLAVLVSASRRLLTRAVR